MFFLMFCILYCLNYNLNDCLFIIKINFVVCFRRITALAETLSDADSPLMSIDSNGVELNLSLSPDRLVEQLHRHGVNLRHLGLVRKVSNDRFRVFSVVSTIFFDSL